MFITRTRQINWEEILRLLKNTMDAVTVQEIQATEKAARTKVILIVEKSKALTSNLVAERNPLQLQVFLTYTKQRKTQLLTTPHLV